MFTQTVEYGLRTMAWLASIAPRSATTKELAAATSVPPAYLSKVIQQLVRAKLLASRRGHGGGVSLTRHPRHLTMLEIVNAIEPIRRISCCPLKIDSHRDCLCPLHRRLDLALARVERVFRESTLAELAAESERDQEANSE